MADVFLSYSREDQALVQRVADGLTTLGYDIWWDAHLPVHRSYGDVIAEEIRVSKAVIVLWSDGAAKSEWVRAEADMARNQRKLVQAALDDVMPPLPFNQIQYALLGDWQGEPDHKGWRKILASLAALMDAPAPPPAPAAPAPAAAPLPPPVPQRGGPSLSTIGFFVLLVILMGVCLWAFVLKDRQQVAPAPLVSSSVDAPAQTPAETSAAPVADIPTGKNLPTPAAIATGDAVPGEADVAPPGGEPRLTFPYENLLAPTDVETLTTAQLGMARNEILARAGYRFKSPALDAWFRQFPWYHAKAEGAVVVLDSLQRANMGTVVEEELRR